MDLDGHVFQEAAYLGNYALLQWWVMGLIAKCNVAAAFQPLRGERY